MGSSGLSSSSYKATDATLRAGLRTLSLIPSQRPDLQIPVGFGTKFPVPELLGCIFQSQLSAAGEPGEAAGDMEPEALPPPVMESESISTPRVVYRHVKPEEPCRVLGFGLMGLGWEVTASDREWEPMLVDTLHVWCPPRPPCGRKHLYSQREENQDSGQLCPMPLDTSNSGQAGESYPGRQLKNGCMHLKSQT